MQGNLAGLIFAWLENFDFSFFLRVLSLKKYRKFYSKGGPFGKMKNQSGLIKLKLNKLNYLLKLCIHIEFWHPSFKTDQFALESFYWLYCPITFLRNSFSKWNDYCYFWLDWTQICCRGDSNFGISYLLWELICWKIFPLQEKCMDSLGTDFTPMQENG